MKEVCSVIVVAALLLAGCTSIVASPSSEEATGSGGNATDAEASGNGTATQTSMNLTVEVVGANATWRVAPMDYLPWNVTVVEVFVDINGTVTEDGDPVDGESVAGETAMRAGVPWGGCLGGCTTGERPHHTRRASYEATTGADGNFSASAGPVYFPAQIVPPLLYPDCEATEIEASGSLADGNETAPSDQDLVEMGVCTQRYT